MKESVILSVRKPLICHPERLLRRILRSDRIASTPTGFKLTVSLGCHPERSFSRRILRSDEISKPVYRIVRADDAQVGASREIIRYDVVRIGPC